MNDGPTATITTIAFSADGTKLFVGGRDKLVHVWERDGPARPSGWRYRDAIRWQVGRDARGMVQTIAPHPQWLAFAGFGHKSGPEIMVFDATLRPLPALLDFAISIHTTEPLAHSFGLATKQMPI